MLVNISSDFFFPQKCKLWTHMSLHFAILFFSQISELTSHNADFFLCILSYISQLNFFPQIYEFTSCNSHFPLNLFTVFWVLATLIFFSQFSFFCILSLHVPIHFFSSGFLVYILQFCLFSHRSLFLYSEFTSHNSIFFSDLGVHISILFFTDF